MLYSYYKKQLPRLAV